MCHSGRSATREKLVVSSIMLWNNYNKQSASSGSTGWVTRGQHTVHQSPGTMDRLDPIGCDSSSFAPASFVPHRRWEERTHSQLPVPAHGRRPTRLTCISMLFLDTYAKRTVQQRCWRAGAAAAPVALVFFVFSHNLLILSPESGPSCRDFGVHT